MNAASQPGSERRAVVSATDVVKRYGALEVLKGVSLAACEHDVITLIGSSGSGKSTFLRCLNLLEIPDAGELVIAGEVIAFKRDAQPPRPANPRQVTRLRAQTGGVFVLRRAQLDFGRAAARLDDEVLIHTGLQRLGRATLLLCQQGRFFDSANARNEGSFLCSARIDLAWVHAATLRPARMEPTLQGILQQLRA